ncbi:MAG TPA: ABC transporter ATP-binding protein [Candidatus Baltobacteraceae bacterium]|nr:ABC transporter ATP-binding protein [Candidatus Baltobacteraceae bacterium]
MSALRQAQDRPLLELRDLNVWIGESHVLHGVSCEIEEGGVTALLGRNGAGKTTTLKGILGMLRRTGRVSLAGTPIERMRTDRIVNLGVAYVPEDREVFSELTVEENLRLAERGARQLQYDVVYELFPEMKTRARQRAGTLSGGQQQMLAIARVLLNRDNRILLVDEPTKGLSPLMLRNVVDSLERAASLVTMLLVEQNLPVANRLAKRAIVLDQGRVGYRGSVAELIENPDLARTHLGLAKGRA